MQNLERAYQALDEIPCSNKFVTLNVFEQEDVHKDRLYEQHKSWQNYTQYHGRGFVRQHLVTIVASSWESQDTTLVLTVRLLNYPYINAEDTEEVNEEVFFDETYSIRLDEKQSHFIKEMD